MSESPIDEEALYDLVDEDPVFLESLVDTFLDDCTSYLEAIRMAIDEEDAIALREKAHGLKGAVANLHAEDARDAARRLEELGRSGDLDEAGGALDDLEHEMERLRTALREMVENV